MGTNNQMRGPRLEFVLVEFDDEWERPVFKFDKKQKKNVPTAEKVQGGYMLYTPMGQSYRITREQATKLGYADRDPVMIGFERVNDVNSPMGRFKFAQSDKARAAAMNEMQQEVIRCCGDRMTLLNMMKEQGEFDVPS